MRYTPVNSQSNGSGGPFESMYSLLKMGKYSIAMLGLPGGLMALVGKFYTFRC